MVWMVRMRRCVCGRPTGSSRHKYCPECRVEVPRARRQAATRAAGTTTQRGYGTAHQRERARWAKTVDRHGHECMRCGGWIAAGEPWDLGHDDHDRSVWTGPEHPACNRATSTRDRRPSRSPGQRVRRATWW